MSKWVSFSFSSTIDFDHNNLPVLLKKKEATEWDLMDKSLLLDFEEEEEVKDE